MLHVRARAGASSIHGIGLIAEEFIPKGTKVWEFVEGFDALFTDTLLRRLAPAAIEQVRWYARHVDAPDGSRLSILSADDDRFTNHADDPNTMTVHVPAHGPLHLAASFAVRDIRPGEEITWNYREFHGLNNDVRVAADSCASGASVAMVDRACSLVAVRRSDSDD